MSPRFITSLWLQITFVTISVLNSFANAQELSNQTEVCGAGGNPIVLAVNHAGFAIAENINETGNFFFSPLSISMAFGMAYLGAGGNTATQIENALGYQRYNISDETVHNSMRQLCEDIRRQATDSGYTLTAANALFSQVEWNLKEDFVEGVKNYYHGNASSVDFAGHPEEATSLINNWTKEKTSNKIEKLFDAPLSSDTIVVLTNAIYFKGTWKIEFPEGRTYDGYFHKSDGTRKEVQMMSLADEKFRYLKDQETGYKFLEMPYKGEQISMLFALPVKHDQMATLKMNSALLCRVQAQMVETELEAVEIPKFNFSYEKELKEVFMAMGIEDAFIRGIANFSGISTGSNLYITKFVHKAVIDVNEKGSEAAAVSGMQIVLFSARSGEVINFVANHPFLFYIIDKLSGTIIFYGRVVDP